MEEATAPGTWPPTSTWPQAPTTTCSNGRVRGRWRRWRWWTRSLTSDSRWTCTGWSPLTPTRCRLMVRVEFKLNCPLVLLFISVRRRSSVFCFQVLSSTGTIPARWALKWPSPMAALTTEAPAQEQASSSPTAGWRAGATSKETTPSSSSVWKVWSRSGCNTHNNKTQIVLFMKHHDRCVLVLRYF